ncbi:hypothetical protein GPALN_012382 [Globodera pallida]|nr:hypothetical protein GPALN_012382 [Globodera pallida]
MQHLEDLWLNNNKIAAWSEVDKLAQLSALHTVYLEHNPLYRTEGAQYRRKAMLALPHIRQLDGTVCRGTAAAVCTLNKQ